MREALIPRSSFRFLPPRAKSMIFISRESDPKISGYEVAIRKASFENFLVDFTSQFASDKAIVIG